jgi:6-phosphogluconate dehydrogenase
MGFNMSSRLLSMGYNLVAYNRTYEKTEQLAKLGAIATESVEALVKNTNSPRVIWLMVPNNAVSKLVIQLSLVLNKGDTVIDGGNTYFKDSITNGKILNKKGINFLDVGVSGGPGGALKGASLMVGGQKKSFCKVQNTV